GVFKDVIFPNCFHTQQLGTGPRRRHELMGRIPSDPVDAVDQKPVGFLTMARYRESGETAASSHVRTVIDNAGIELQKPIEATSIQRQVFDLLLGDQS